MALVALLMKPWLSYMRAHRVEPRVLADDLFMYASRMKHASATMQGMNLSRQFFADVGAKVADNKCFITSTCATTRAKLRTITWAQTTSPTATDTRCTDGKPPRDGASHDAVGNSSSVAGVDVARQYAAGESEQLTCSAPPRQAGTSPVIIKVANHFRDLGAHMSMDKTNTNLTLTQRLRRATQWVRRLRSLPITHEQKIQTIRTMILPAACYGSEVGHCSQVELKALRTAIVEAIGPKSARRSVPLIMELVGAQGDIDPAVHMLVRKVSLLLRIIAKFPSTKIKVRSLLCAYATQHRKGTPGWLGLEGEDEHRHNVGPISHLLVDLHQVGATLNSELVLQQVNEVDLPLTTTPWQHIQPLIAAIGQRTRYHRAHTQREHTQSTPAIDHQTLHRAMTKQTHTNRSIVRYIASGAAWVQQHLSGLEQNVTSKCKLCGQVEESILHGLWHCPCVREASRAIRAQQQQHRQQAQAEDQEACVSAAMLLEPPPVLPVWTQPGVPVQTQSHLATGQTTTGTTSTTRPTQPNHHTNFPAAKDLEETQVWFDIEPNDLPTSLLHGIPPDMSSHLTHTYWGLPPTHVRTSTKQARAHLGLNDSTRHRKHITEAQDIEAQNLLAEQQAQHLGARQGFQTLRGPHPPAPSIALPEPCEELPPEEPNAFSDGSLHSPTEPSFSLGGAGAWHPGRQLHTKGPSEAEANLAVLSQQGDGLKLYTHLLGYGGSSTRLEIAGAIVTFAADGPIHLGTDSKSFLTKALAIHHHIHNHTMPKRPWALQKDGDLWHLYYQHVKAKGTNSIAITKVKGHATQAMVDDGTVQPEHKVGNDMADEAADEGVHLFGDAVVRLGKRLANRHKAYTNMLASLLEHIGFIFQVRAMLLQQQQVSHTTTHQAHTPGIHTTAPPYQPAHSPPHRFRQIIVAQQCPQLCRRCPAILQVQTFMQDMPYWPAPNPAQPPEHHSPSDNHYHFTWLELYTLYRLGGNPEPVTYDKTSAQTRPALRQQLHAFRHAVRQLALHTMPETMHPLFRGKHQGHTKRLQGLGIHTHLAALPWQPCLTTGAQERLALEVLRSQHRLSPVKAGQAIEAKQVVPLRPVQLKGRAKWSSSIRPYQQALYAAKAPNQSTTTTTGPSSTTPQDFGHHTVSSAPREDGPATSGRGEGRIPAAMLLETPPASPVLGRNPGMSSTTPPPLVSFTFGAHSALTDSQV